MTTVHRGLASSIILYFFVIAAWGLYQWVRGQQPSGSFLGAVILGEALIVAQSLVGLLLVATGHHPKAELHWLYGAVLLMSMPVAYALGGQREQDRQVTLYYFAGALLIVVIAIVRASATG